MGGGGVGWLVGREGGGPGESQFFYYGVGWLVGGGVGGWTDEQGQTNLPLFGAGGGGGAGVSVFF